MLGWGGKGANILKDITIHNIAIFALFSCHFAVFLIFIRFIRATGTATVIAENQRSKIHSGGGGENEKKTTQISRNQ